MARFINDRGGAVLVTALLILQLALFLLSMDAGAYAKISVFCTGPASSRLGLLFGLLHLLFVVLWLVGLLSLQLTRLRMIYVGLLAASLGMLAVQAVFVFEGTLTSDSP
jgi:hypothetical protein